MDIQVGTINILHNFTILTFRVKHYAPELWSSTARGRYLRTGEGWLVLLLGLARDDAEGLGAARDDLLALAPQDCDLGRELASLDLERFDGVLAGLLVGLVGLLPLRGGPLADQRGDHLQAGLLGRHLRLEQLKLRIVGGLGLGLHGLAILARGLRRAAALGAGLRRRVHKLRTLELRARRTGAAGADLVLTRAVLTLGTDREPQDAREGLLQRHRQDHALACQLGGASQAKAEGALSLDDGTHGLPVSLAVGAVAQLGAVGVHHTGGTTIAGLATEVDALAGLDGLCNLEHAREPFPLGRVLGLGLRLGGHLGLFGRRLGLGLALVRLGGGLELLGGSLDHTARDLERDLEGVGLELEVLHRTQALLAEASRELAVHDTAHLCGGTVAATPAGAVVHEHAVDLLDSVATDLDALEEGFHQLLDLGLGILGLLDHDPLGLSRFHHQGDGLAVVVRD